MHKNTRKPVGLPSQIRRATVYPELPQLPGYSEAARISEWHRGDALTAGSTPAPAPEDTPHYVLDFSDGNRITVEHRCVAGRSPAMAGETYDQYAVVNDPSGETSRRHFEFGVTATGQVWVMDLASSNGTWIQTANSSRQIPAKIRQPLNIGDTLRFGSLSATLQAHR